MNNKKTGKTKLSIRRGYRDENGKVKNTTIKNLGDLEDLRKQFDDPIPHFKPIVKKMNEDEKLSIDTENIKNFGYSAFSKIYHELELDKF